MFYPYFIFEHFFPFWWTFLHVSFQVCLPFNLRPFLVTTNWFGWIVRSKQTNGMRTRAQQQKNSIQNWIRIKDGKKTVRINYLWPLWMWHTSRICSMLTLISLVALQHFFSVCIGCVYAHKICMVWFGSLHRLSIALTEAFKYAHLRRKW